MFISKTSGRKFHTESESEFYFNNFKNPNKRSEISLGDIYYVDRYTKNGSDVLVEPFFFEVALICKETDRIHFLQVDSQLHSIKEPTSLYRSHDIYWLPIRGREVSKLLYSCSNFDFHSKMNIFDKNNMPSSHLMTDYTSFQHGSTFSDLSFISVFDPESKDSYTFELGSIDF